MALKTSKVASLAEVSVTFEGRIWCLKTKRLGSRPSTLRSIRALPHCEGSFEERGQIGGEFLFVEFAGIEHLGGQVFHWPGKGRELGGLFIGGDPLARRTSTRGWRDFMGSGEGGLSWAGAKGEGVRAPQKDSARGNALIILSIIVMLGDKRACASLANAGERDIGLMDRWIYGGKRRISRR